VKIMSQFIKVLKTIIIMIDNMAHFFGTNVLAKNRKNLTLKTRN
jgi:hypothetical protein